MKKKSYTYLLCDGGVEDPVAVVRGPITEDELQEHVSKMDRRESYKVLLAKLRKCSKITSAVELDGEVYIPYFREGK